MERRTHIPGAGPDSVQSAADREFIPKEISREEFGRRVYSLMLDKGWTQAELSRRSGITPDGISKYIRGLIMPTRQSLNKLAEVFGIEPDQILANLAKTAIDQGKASIEFKVSASDPTKSWLTVNRMVRTNTAVQVISLLEKDDAADGS